VQVDLSLLRLDMRLVRLRIGCRWSRKPLVLRNGSNRAVHNNSSGSAIADIGLVTGDDEDYKMDNAGI
jgi:hypothetical protein